MFLKEKMTRRIADVFLQTNARNTKFACKPEVSWRNGTRKKSTSTNINRQVSFPGYTNEFMSFIRGIRVE